MANSMKYALFGDVHANLPALRAVLQDMSAQGCTDAACLGDIPGYFSEPKECLDVIRAMNIPCVKGNHDACCSDERPLEGINPKAADFWQWTRQQLTEDDKAWLRNLKYVETVAGFTIVHATLKQPERWFYMFDRAAAAEHFPHQETQVCFFGHTHVPVAFIWEKPFLREAVVRGGTYPKFRVDPGRRYLINPGSVGQPRDGDLRASYATYDLDTQVIELRRVAYEFPPDDPGYVPAPGRPSPDIPRLRRRYDEPR